MPRTYAPQISQQTDQRLHQLSAIIGRAKLRLAKFQRVHDIAWEECFSLMEEHNTDEGFKFLARDGHSLQKQKRQRQPYLDEQVLHDLMLSAYGNEEKWNAVTEPVLNPAFATDSAALFAKIWEVLGQTRGMEQAQAYTYMVEALNVRKVNPTLLSQAYATDVNLRQMAQEALITPDPTYARVRNEWTAEDQNRSAVFGIFKVPIEDQEEIVITMDEYRRLTGEAPPPPAVLHFEADQAVDEEGNNPADPHTPPYTPPEPVRRGRGRPRRQQ